MEGKITFLCVLTIWDLSEAQVFFLAQKRSCQPPRGGALSSVGRKLC